MPTWWNRLTTFWTPQPPAAARPSPRQAAAPDRRREPEPADWLDAAPPSDAQAEAPLLGWFFDMPLDTAAPLSPDQSAWLERLDAVIDSDAARHALLPRAPQVIPQLLASLRDDTLQTTTAAGHIARDVVLTAEVLRLANSAARRSSTPVVRLDHAITTLGTIGLRQVIARHVMRPIFEAPAGTLAARAAPRIVEHADQTARYSATMAPWAGLDAFEAYLAGLVNDIGWTAACRAMAVIDTQAAEHIGTAFMQPFIARRHRLFGRIVAPWQLTPSITSMAEAMARSGEGATSRLARVVQLASRLAQPATTAEDWTEWLSAAPPQLVAALTPAQPKAAA